MCVAPNGCIWAVERLHRYTYVLGTFAGESFRQSCKAFCKWLAVWIVWVCFDGGSVLVVVDDEQQNVIME